MVSLTSPKDRKLEVPACVVASQTNADSSSSPYYYLVHRRAQYPANAMSTHVPRLYLTILLLSLFSQTISARRGPITWFFIDEDDGRNHCGSVDGDNVRFTRSHMLLVVKNHALTFLHRLYFSART